MVEDATGTALPAVAAELFNIAAALPQRAALHPFRKAIVFPEGRTANGRRCYSHLTYAQLDRTSDLAAHALVRTGIGRGQKTLLMVRPGPDFVALTFALFKIGAVPVLIDPGMGRANLARAIAGVAPEALVGIPLAHLFTRLHPRACRTIRRRVVAGRRLERRFDHSDGPFPPAPTRADDPAAILFTTGSTGPPKGVCYEHGMFGAQVEMIREHFGIAEEEVDLPAFPLFVLFSVAWGTTSVIPDMDPSRPARCDPARLVEAITDHGVSYSFGSPAIWRRVGQHCALQGIRLPSLRRILMAGAPVPDEVMAPFDGVLGPGARIHTPYGATEALPLCSITGRERRALPPGRGVCVGRPLPGVELRILGIEDGPIEQWDERRCLPPGEIGEIVVAGPCVTRRYENEPRHTALAKIHQGERVWHRMGDLGYLDDEGRLWFCGRKAHRVTTAEGRTLYSVPCEAVTNRHPAVFRSALVGVRGRPAIVVELREGQTASEALTAELRGLAAADPETAGIETVLYHPSFPVDIRHNAKIFREKLALWAAERVS